VERAKVLVMGLAFKENCPDLRNTRVVDIIAELKDYNCDVDVFDPWVSLEEALHEYGLPVLRQPKSGIYDAIILAVAHDEFKGMGAASIRALGKESSILYDLKYVLASEDSDLRL
jgi:UDP-N-acetyl-D-galactosamine dehydrogenase